jgi:hypothetical protein
MEQNPRGSHGRMWKATRRIPMAPFLRVRVLRFVRSLRNTGTSSKRDALAVGFSCPVSKLQAHQLLVNSTLSTQRAWNAAVFTSSSSSSRASTLAQNYISLKSCGMETAESGRGSAARRNCNRTCFLGARLALPGLVSPCLGGSSLSFTTKSQTH